MFSIKMLTCYRFMGFNNDKRNKVDMRDDLSYFAGFNSDRIDWDAHKCHTFVHIQLERLYFPIDDNTAVSDAGTDCGISKRTVMDNSNDENEVCTCEAETEC
jgi:hypothetical protein